MPKRRRPDITEARARAIHGGVLLGKSSPKRLVRNNITGRVLPCCYDDCMKDGDDRYQVRVPHDNPRWTPKAGTNDPPEKLIYIFCSEKHKEIYLAYRAMK